MAAIPFARAPVNFETAAPYLKEALDNGWLTTGPLTERFTSALSDYLAAPNLVALSSCTAALQIALAAANLPAGSEVIVPANTFIATFETVELAGLKPVLADIDRDTWNISLESITSRISENTSAVIAVPFAGNPINMDELQALCRRHKLTLILDCAHALETRYRGQPLHHYADYSCYSFYATKNLTTAEGGALICPAEKLELVRALSLHGMSRAAWKRYSGGPWRYDIIATGYKANLTDIHAAIGLAQLGSLTTNHARRLELVERYRQQLGGLPVRMQHMPANTSVADHAHHLFCISLSANAKRTRDDLMNALAAKQIGFSVHFIPIYEFTHTREEYDFPQANFPHTAEYFAGALSLPLYPTLTNAQQDEVIATLLRAFADT